MKVAFVGDVHFDRKIDNPSLLKYLKEGQYSFFEWFVNDLKEKNINTVFFSGDIFNSRITINIESLIKVKRLFKDLMKDFNIKIVLGNHDIYYENSKDISSLEILEDISNVTVYRKSIICEKINDYNLYIVPWILKDEYETFSTFLNEISKNREKNILFGHFDILGIDMEGGNISSFGLSSDLFSNASKYVISGHYHGKSLNYVNDSIILYLGSPYPLTFANSDAQHGYWIVDENMNIDFVENKISPKFTTIFDTDDLNKIKDLSNYFVRLYINNSRTKEEIFNIRTLIDSKKPLFLSVIPYKDGSDEENKFENQRLSNNLLNMDLLSLSELYINNNEDNLPNLKTIPDPKQEIMNIIKNYMTTLNINVGGF